MSNGAIYCLSAYQALATDSDNVAVDTVGIRSGEKCDGFCHIYGFSALAHGVHSSANFSGHEWNGIGHGGFNEAWRNRIDCYFLFSQLFGHVFNVANDTGFRGGVIGLANLTCNAVHGGDTDNSAAFIEYVIF